MKLSALTAILLLSFGFNTKADNAIGGSEKSISEKPISANTSADPILSDAPEKISDHVWVIEDRLTTPLVPNIGFVIGKKAILVVDTGLGAKNGKFVYDTAVKLAPKHHVYLVTTHFHPEHDLGASAFPKSTDLIRAHSELEDIAEFNLGLAREFSKRSKINATLLKGAKYRKADVTFEDEKFLDLGDLDVRLVELGPNHTRGDVGIFVEGDRVLFSGDDAMKGLPSFASPYSSLEHWLKTLDFLTRLRPKIVVPSHGPVGGKSYISDYRKYFQLIRDRVATLKSAGKSEDDSVKQVSDEMISAYPNRERLEGAIRNAFREAEPPAKQGSELKDPASK